VKRFKHGFQEIDNPMVAQMVGTTPPPTSCYVKALNGLHEMRHWTVEQEWLLLITLHVGLYILIRQQPGTKIITVYSRLAG
jgi:hypothetical protein